MLFSNSKKLAATFCGILTCLSLPFLQGLESGGYIDITNGYRNDELTATIRSYDPKKTFIGSDHLKASDIDIYQLGLKSKLMLCNLFMRLDASYGWSCDGNYTETSRAANPSLPPVRVKADLYQCRVKDISIGGGYLWSYTDSFALGPTVGWSYDYQYVKTKHARTNGVSDPVLNNLSYSNYWHGPWLGFEATYEQCQYAVNFGYEYHWAAWHAKWRLHGPDVLGVAFSDRRHADNAFGQVVFIDGYWEFCPSWTLGMGFKYQYWKATHGRERPWAGSFAAVGLNDTEVDRLKSATWSSYAITIDLGYIF